jgi:hypothetical protein
VENRVWRASSRSLEGFPVPILSLSPPPNGEERNVSFHAHRLGN